MLLANIQFYNAQP